MNKAKPQAVPVDIRAVYQDTKARYPVTWAMLAQESVAFGSLSHVERDRLLLERFGIGPAEGDA